MSNTLKPEQIEAINYDGGNILVSASAGSGKTFVMINRLIEIIKSGRADINSVLAVTFTEAAASEMKAKLKDALIKSIKAGQSHLANMLSEVATADISTVHGFCAKLIRTYFFEAGVAPDFVVADQSRSDTLKQECINKTFAKYYADGDKEFFDLLDKLSERRSDDRLKQTVLSLFDFFGGEANPLEFANGFLDDSLQAFNNLKDAYFDYLYDDLKPLKNSAYDYQRELISSGYESGAGFAQAVIDQIDAITSHDLYAVKAYEGVKVKLNFERKLSDRAKEIKEELTKIRDVLFSVINDYAQHLTDCDTDYKRYVCTIKDARKLVEITQNFTERYSLSKREENLLDFADLEHYALRILNNPEICQTVRDKYKYIFVDEYQDVNGVQEALIGKIANNNLFMVGDAKQSIYGFRGCNPEFFINKAEQMPKRGEKTVFLNYNFRSADAVIQLVNQMFLYSMTEEYFGIPYHKNMLVAGGIYPDYAKGRTQVHFLKKPSVTPRIKEEPKVYDLLERLHERASVDENKISALVYEIINQELGKEIFDTKLNVMRKVSYGDICILTRNRENAYVSGLVNGLVRRNVPVISSVAQNIANLPHVQALINVLKLIDNFTQDLPLASTLKSPVGRFSDEDLAEIVVTAKEQNPNNRLSFYQRYKYCVQNLGSDLGDRLRAFDGYFSNIRMLADFCSAHEILKRIIADSEYETELVAERRGEFKLKCLNKFLSSTVTADKRLTVKEFLTLIENKPDVLSLAPDLGDDNVRVMTMHASKGLEFPVVIICGMEKKMRVESDANLMFKDRKFGVALKYFDQSQRTHSETLLRGVIKQKSRIEGIKEELRLFYVATTRATYSMHLIYEGSKIEKRNGVGRATCFMDYIPKDVQIAEHQISDFGFESLLKPYRHVLVGKPNDDVCKEISNNLNFKYKFSAETTLPLKSSVTAELAKAYEEQGALCYVVDDENTSDKERGLIAHKLMEHLDFDDLTNFDGQVDGMINSNVLTEKQVGKINLSRLKNAVNSPVLSFLKNASLYREKSFISAIKGSSVVDTQSDETVLVQGIIDLLAIKDGVAYVVDYKYSSLTADSLKLKYRKQLEVYKLAVENSLRITVKDMLIVNLLTGDVVRID